MSRFSPAPMRVTHGAPSAGYCASPLGLLRVEVTEAGIASLSLASGEQKRTAPSPLAKRCIAELREYFAGSRQTFTLPLMPNATPFRKKVWEETAKIPFGETATYAELAKRIGRPRAARAVGQALGANPVAIIVPCHRVVALQGKGGYAWGLRRKNMLLAHEKKVAQKCD